MLIIGIIGLILQTTQLAVFLVILGMVSIMFTKQIKAPSQEKMK
jgi:hypothetical protein